MVLAAEHARHEPVTPVFVAAAARTAARALHSQLQLFVYLFPSDMPMVPYSSEQSELSCEVYNQATKLGKTTREDTGRATINRTLRRLSRPSPRRPSGLRRAARRAQPSASPARATPAAVGVGG